MKNLILLFVSFKWNIFRVIITEHRKEIAPVLSAQRINIVLKMVLVAESGALSICLCRITSSQHYSSHFLEVDTPNLVLFHFLQRMGEGTLVLFLQATCLHFCSHLFFFGGGYGLGKHTHQYSGLGSVLRFTSSRSQGGGRKKEKR